MDQTIVEWVFVSVPLQYLLAGTIMAACIFSFCLKYIYPDKKKILNHITEGEPLVEQREVTYVQEAVFDICQQQSKLFKDLLDQHLDHGRWLLDYEGISKSTEYREIQQLMERLRLIKVERLPLDHRKAFFINTYNFLTIDALVRNRKKGMTFWRDTAYELGGQVYSLDDIEHGILRSNRPHPITGSQIAHDDPRTVGTIEIDPRIHAALNCGAKSCPKIHAYTAENINEELDNSAKEFCNDWVEVYEGTNQIRVSKIFSWYKVDFGSDITELAAWLHTYLDEPKRTQLDSVRHSPDFKVKFASYDWATNEQSKSKI